MALIALPSLTLSLSSPCFCKVSVRGKQQFMSPQNSNDSFRRNNSIEKAGGLGVRACLFNPNQQPILKEALKEPVAFVGGIFAGLLRLDLNEDPLKEWVARTVEAAGISEEEISSNDVKEEETPQQIVIE